MYTIHIYIYTKIINIYTNIKIYKFFILYTATMLFLGTPYPEEHAQFTREDRYYLLSLTGAR